MRRLELIILLLMISNAPVLASDPIAELINKATMVSKSNPQQGAFYAKQALDSLGEHPSKLRTQALIAYSYANRLQSNYDVALKTLFDARDEVDPSDTRLRGEIYFNLSRMYNKLGDNHRAIEYVDQATSIFKSLRDSSWIAECYNGRGVIHYEMGELSTADLFLNRALEINRQRHSLTGIAFNINNLCLYPGDTERKLELIQEAIVINKNLGSTWSLGENYNNLGKQLYYSNRYHQALEALKQARKYAVEVNSPELLGDYYEYSTMVYAALKDYKNAYLYVDSMNKIRSDMQGGIKLRNIEHSINQQQLLKEKYKAESQKQEYRISILLRNIWLLLAILIILLVVSFSIARKRRHDKAMQEAQSKFAIQKYQQELDSLKLSQQQLQLTNIKSALDDSKKEITNFAMFLHSRKELQERLQEMIREGYKLNGDELKAHLKKINAFINQYENNDRTSSMLMLSIEDKHNEFINRLLDKHPDLTEGEKYLATLIRINMPTKEIALLTGTTAKTVNMNRYRLRKSLKLDPETDLNEYLSTL